MSNTIQFKRGNFINIPSPADNEPYYITDFNNLRVGSGSALRGVGEMSQANVSRVYYVSPSGSYSATGLTIDESTTLQGAVQKAKNVNWNQINRVYVQLANGTYNVSQSIDWSNTSNVGQLWFRGNSGSPQSVIINSTHTHSFTGIFNTFGGSLKISDLSLQTSYADVVGNNQVAVSAYQDGLLYCWNVRFGGTFYRYVSVGEGSVGMFDNGLNIYGKCRDTAFYAYRNSEIQLYNSTISFTGTPSINTFLAASEGSIINNYGTTNFSGSRSITTSYKLSNLGILRGAPQYPGTNPVTSSNYIGLIP